MDCPGIVSAQRRFFESGATMDAGFRLEQLRKLERAVISRSKELSEAVYADFKKSEFETLECEIAPLAESARFASKSLKKWSAPKMVRTNFANFPGRSFFVPEPLGVSLVIGAWNYPYYLTFGPLVAAIVAGCTAVLKPSELAPNSASAMAALVSDIFDPAYVCLLEGGADVASGLLSQKFDKIFFTGSRRVGEIVCAAAARNLTPITLELGGKSPAFVDGTFRMDVCAKRLAWAKFLNAGQTCVAPDYVLVRDSAKASLLEALKRRVEESRYSLENGNYVQIVNRANFERLAALLEGENIVCGGLCDAASRTISPTLVDCASFESPLMREEIFGPILPVIGYSDLDAAMAKARSLPRPLSCYAFSSSRETRNRILSGLSFGCGAANDALMQITNERLPFGGVGASGMGAYHGEAGFAAFSHYKGILEKGARFESGFRYPPYNEKKLSMLKRFFRL